MNLTTYLYLVQRLRMPRDIPPLPHMPLWYSQKLSFYLTILLPTVNNRNATSHPEDEGSYVSLHLHGAETPRRTSFEKLILLDP
jgi:hypothetical protein